MARKTRSDAFYATAAIAGFLLLLVAVLVWGTIRGGDRANFNRALELEGFALFRVADLMAVMLFLSLTLERALEVFAGTFRDPGKQQLKNMHALAVSELRDCEAGEIARRDRLHQQALSLELALGRYGAETQRLMLMLGLVLGLLTSLGGARILGALDDSSLGTDNSLQSAAFNVVDVFLTGSLLAGGSHGIHRILMRLRPPD